MHPLSVVYVHSPNGMYNTFKESVIIKKNMSPVPPLISI